MSRRPIGKAAMTDAERSRRHREKARALRDAATPPADLNDQAAQANASASDAMAAPSPGQPGPADYPRMLFHADGTTLVVQTPEEHARRMADGWSPTAFAVHLQRPITYHGFLGADNPFVWPMRRW
jgi:hypothetical protein